MRAVVGERWERRRWREERPERVAAVGEGRRSNDQEHSPETATGYRPLQRKMSTAKCIMLHFDGWRFFDTLPPALY